MNRQTFLVQKVVVVASALAAVAAGCSNGEDDYPVPSTGDGGLPGRMVTDTSVDSVADARDGASQSEGGGGTGDGGGEGGSDTPSSHIVTLTIDGPSSGQVLVAGARFTPAVKVTVDSTNATDSETVTDVTATVTKMGSKTSGASAQLKLTKLEQVPESSVAIHQFTDTPVDIAKLESGIYELAVVATTNSGIKANSTVLFQIDAGPVIRIDSPAENSYYRDSTIIDVTVSDALFPVQNVTMLLGQRELTISGPSPNGQYSGTIQFGAFDPPLAGDQLLTVQATNDKGTRTVARRKFVSDNRGPTITSTVPDTGALIGRVITISAQVSDPAGVLESSVVAVIAHGDRMFEVKLEPPAAGSTLPPGTYQALFDTARLPVNAIFPSISFRASDIPGNQSSVGYLVSLDNTPPLADLDPPETFYLVKRFGNEDWCSWPFDPLGSDAVDDGDTVRQVFDVRARIEDQGNSPLGGADFVPISGVDNNRVQLLILDDSSKALVVDTNGDELCDAINPLLTPTTTPMSSSDALLVNFAPVPLGGDSIYMPQIVPLPAGAPCISGGAGTAPDPLCSTTDTTQALHYANAGLSAIYAIPPISSDGLQCVGRQFDTLGNYVQDGWICVAVAVSDVLGNTQVSRPLRICVDKDGQNNECGAGRPPMPDCTGTQTATRPDVVVDASRPCRPWRAFDEIEFRRSR